MSIEQNIEVIAGYSFSNVANLDQALLFVDSLHKETNRKPDEFKFWVDKGGLVDPATNQYLHDTLKPESHPIPYLGRVESTVIKKMDELTTKNNEGCIFWLSPWYKVPGGYPGHKLEILEITKSPAGQKETKNEVICFDCNETELRDIAGELFEEFNVTLNLEDVRQTVLYRKSADINLIKIKIAGFIADNKNYQIMKPEDRTYIAHLMINGADSRFIAYEMERLGILGQYSISCPSGKNTSNSLSDILMTNSLITEVGGWHHGVCRICKAATWVGPCDICRPCEPKA